MSGGAPRFHQESHPLPHQRPLADPPGKPAIPRWYAGYRPAAAYALPTSLDVNWHGFEGKVGALHEDARGAAR